MARERVASAEELELERIDKRLSAQVMDEIRGVPWEDIVRDNAKRNRILDLLAYQRVILNKLIGRTVVVPTEGVVSRLLVAVGDQVQQNQSVALLDVTWLGPHNELRTDAGGTITDIYIAEGERVDAGAIIMDVNR